MCVTDCHDMTLAVKVTLNPKTTNQNLSPTIHKLWPMLKSSTDKLSNKQTRLSAINNASPKVHDVVLVFLTKGII